MKKLKVIKGIGYVENNGEVVEKSVYEGKKGFKVVVDGLSKNVYLLETQKKLFDVSKDITLFFNEKALVVPMKSITSFLNLKYKAYFEETNKILGVFNTSGDLIALAQRVQLKDDYFMAADKVSNGWKWGLYNYNGEEILPKEFSFIQSKKIRIFGKTASVCYLSSKKETALISTDGRILIPWGPQDIIVRQRNNTVLVKNWYDKNTNRYNFTFDEEGKINLTLSFEKI